MPYIFRPYVGLEKVGIPSYDCRMPPAPQPAIDRLLARAVRDPVSGCLLSGHARDKRTGYAKIRVKDGNGRWRWGYAHRVAYEDHYGPIPDGLEIDHVLKRGCVHRHCIAWEHLEAVTPKENQARGGARDATIAAHASQTACRRAGHPYTPENTYLPPGGPYRNRICRECKRVANQGYKARRRAAART